MSRETAHDPARPSLRTSEGELLRLSVSVELRQLENLLAMLGGLPFPVNPEIVHLAMEGNAGSTRSAVNVHFPVYERRISEVIVSLERAGFTRDLLTVRAALSGVS